MKIGEFAKRFNTKITTIRYYINNGLLVPKVQNGKYVFSSADIKDMEYLLRLKTFRFTIPEMQSLIFMEKTSRLNDNAVINVYANTLNQKLDALKKERGVLDQIITNLQDDIESLSKPITEERGIKGIPITAIPYLYCPECNVPLNIDSASLSNGYINAGNLCCDCGYSSTIENNLIICSGSEESPIKVFENVESIISYKDDLSATYRQLINKAYSFIDEKINKQREGLTLLLGPFTYNFLLKRIENLGKNNIYIVVDPSKKKLQKMSQYLAKDYDVMFINAHMCNLPLKKGSIDYYIDDYSLTNNLFVYNNYGVSDLSDLVKINGKIIGIFSKYNHAQKGLQGFRDSYPKFQPSKLSFIELKKALNDNGFRLMDEESMGFTTANSIHYKYDYYGEKVEICGYMANKQKSE